MDEKTGSRIAKSMVMPQSAVDKIPYGSQVRGESTTLSHDKLDLDVSVDVVLHERAAGQLDGVHLLEENASGHCVIHLLLYADGVVCFLSRPVAGSTNRGLN